MRADAPAFVPVTTQHVVPVGAALQPFPRRSSRDQQPFALCPVSPMTSLQIDASVGVPAGIVDTLVTTGMDQYGCDDPSPLRAADSPGAGLAPSCAAPGKAVGGREGGEQEPSVADGRRRGHLIQSVAPLPALDHQRGDIVSDLGKVPTVPPVEGATPVQGK